MGSWLVSGIVYKIGIVLRESFTKKERRQQKFDFQFCALMFVWHFEFFFEHKLIVVLI